MKWNDLRIGQKLMIGFGSALALLLAVVFVSLSGFKVILASSRAVNQSEEISAELLQREVDHLKWAQEVERYANRGDASRPLTVQLDPTQCGSERQSHAVGEISGIIFQMNEQSGRVTGSTENFSRISEETSASTLEMIASIEQVARHVEELFASVNATSASVEQILGANQNVAHSTDSLDELIAKTTTAITEIDASIKEVQSLAQDARTFSEQAQQRAARDGSVAVGEAISEIEQIRKAVLDLSESMKNFAGRVDSIGEILDVIDDVAEQTNLLALNAAIIAAQAGEHALQLARQVTQESLESRELSERSVREVAAVQTSARRGAGGGLAHARHRRELQRALRPPERNAEPVSHVSNEAGSLCTGMVLGEFRRNS